MMGVAGLIPNDIFRLKTLKSDSCFVEKQLRIFKSVFCKKVTVHIQCSCAFNTLMTETPERLSPPFAFVTCLHLI